MRALPTRGASEFVRAAHAASSPDAEAHTPRHAPRGGSCCPRSRPTGVPAPARAARVVAFSEACRLLPDVARAHAPPVSPSAQSAARVAMDAQGMTRREALEAQRPDDARQIQPRRFEIVLRCGPSPSRHPPRQMEFPPRLRTPPRPPPPLRLSPLTSSPVPRSPPSSGNP